MEDKERDSMAKRAREFLAREHGWQDVGDNEAERFVAFAVSETADLRDLVERQRHALLMSEKARGIERAEIVALRKELEQAREEKHES